MSACDGAIDAAGDVLGDSEASGVVPPTGVSAGRHSVPSEPGQQLLPS